ncbi:hypothetical protein NGM10_11850 [Halorussus salilacus]|uniref:hypothetical protein n=1 Tax=Halorussus salilacus TaxID=2953750 RepID=UPI0020A044C9|nr:hypothetical protein [Halorussus salilacus]USZ67419.1 hypothetical protein NGM10_11850 [Halorussus salilacus]
MTTETETETEAQTGTDDLAPADRVVISYPEDLSDWGRFQVEGSPFKAFLRKTKTDRVRQGDVWEEFVGVGCCGSTLDVPLRVERIEGGETLGPETAVEFEVREACGIRGGWQVQSEGGPNEV